MNEIGNTLKNQTGPASLPLWLMAAGAVLVTLVVALLVAGVFLDWRRRRMRRRERRMRHVWDRYPAPQRTRPLAWFDPMPEEQPELKLMPRASEDEQAA